MTKLKFNYKDPVAPFVNAGNFIGTRYYIGNGHFIFKKSVSPLLVDILKKVDDRYEVYGAPMTDKRVKSVIPKDLIDEEFIPTRFIKEGNKNKYLTDENDVFNSKYYWLITEYLRLRIFPFGDYNNYLTFERLFDPKPFAIVNDNGDIVGCIMPCVRSLINE